jgi:hypothetical protein
MPSKFFESTRFVSTYEVQNILIIAFLIGRLAKYERTACDKYIQDFIQECAKLGPNASSNSALIYIYSLPNISLLAKQQIAGC